MLPLANGREVQWLRFMGWLLTCPVLLMGLLTLGSVCNPPPRVKLVPVLVANLVMIVSRRASRIMMLRPSPYAHRLAVHPPTSWLLPFTLALHPHSFSASRPPPSMTRTCSASSFASPVPPCHGPSALN